MSANAQHLYVETKKSIIEKRELRQNRDQARALRNSFMQSKLDFLNSHEKVKKAKSINQPVIVSEKLYRTAKYKSDKAETNHILSDSFFESNRNPIIDKKDVFLKRSIASLSRKNLKYDVEKAEYDLNLLILDTHKPLETIRAVKDQHVKTSLEHQLYANRVKVATLSALKQVDVVFSLE
jgi:hypothetical protein